MDKNTLLSYMPNYYRTSEVIDNLNNSNAIELTRFNSDLENTLNQFFIDTADFTLERWERNFGIEVNNNYDINYRRTKILSKIRGSGTITISLIKNMSESFNNGEVEVIENSPDYSFTVKFISNKGLPPNIEDLKNAIEDIKPAHLLVVYEYNFNTYEELSEFKYGTFMAYTYDELRNENLSTEFSHELLSHFTHERLGVFLNG